MALPREALFIVALIIVIAALAMIVQFVRLSSFDSDASRFVTEDLRAKYPYGDIDIMSMSHLKNAEGADYLEVKARLTEKAGTPCPERSHIFYNYPEQNFVPQPPEVITSRCEVCSESPCVIAFPEEAVIASHTLAGSDAIEAYISDYPDASASALEQAGSWLVTWDSPSASFVLQSSITRSGSIVDVNTVPKPS
jgi:hypothetical protein